MSAANALASNALYGETLRLCSGCAHDTGAADRYPSIEVVNPLRFDPCGRCGKDGKLLTVYRVCCKATGRFDHTPACKAQRPGKPLRALGVQAVLLFSTDPRVLALIEPLEGEKGVNIGRAWDLGGNGHQPELTYRKEAEDRAFRMLGVWLTRKSVAPSETELRDPIIEAARQLIPLFEEQRQRQVQVKAFSQEQAKANRRREAFLRPLPPSQYRKCSECWAPSLSPTGDEVTRHYPFCNQHRKRPGS